MINLLDHGYVKLIPDGCWGSDEIIIESARMSTNKGFQGWGPKPCPQCKADETGLHFNDISSTACGGGVNPPKCDGSSTIPGDEKLLRYLWEHKHSTPFEMAGLMVEIQAPIMVFREWHRHRTQSYSEMSGRYTELPELAYIPSVERLIAGKQSTSNKQSSEGGFTQEEAEGFQLNFECAYQDSRHHYEEFLKLGLSRELARLVLPVNQYSRMRASANLRNWLGFLTLRLDPAAQFEIRVYAEAVATFIKERFPRTYELYSE